MEKIAQFEHFIKTRQTLRLVSLYNTLSSLNLTNRLTYTHNHDMIHLIAATSPNLLSNIPLVNPSSNLLELVLRKNQDFKSVQNIYSQLLERKHILSIDSYVYLLGLYKLNSPIEAKLLFEHMKVNIPDTSFPLIVWTIMMNVYSQLSEFDKLTEIISTTRNNWKYIIRFAKTRNKWKLSALELSDRQETLFNNAIINSCLIFASNGIKNPEILDLVSKTMESFTSIDSISDMIKIYNLYNLDPEPIYEISKKIKINKDLFCNLIIGFSKHDFKRVYDDAVGNWGYYYRFDSAFLKACSVSDISFGIEFFEKCVKEGKVTKSLCFYAMDCYRGKGDLDGIERVKGMSNGL